MNTVRKMTSRDGFRINIIRVYRRTRSSQLRGLRKACDAEPVLAETFAAEQTMIGFCQQLACVMRIVRKTRQPEGSRKAHVPIFLGQEFGGRDGASHAIGFIARGFFVLPG